MKRSEIALYAVTLSQCQQFSVKTIEARKVTSFLRRTIVTRLFDFYLGFGYDFSTSPIRLITRHEQPLGMLYCISCKH